MSRLPRPGSDDDIWGDILNDFLSVSLNTDGSLKAAGDIADAKSKADSAVQSVNGKSGTSVTLTATDVGAISDSNVVHLTGNETIGGTKTFTSSPVVPTPTTSTQAANKSYVDSVAGGGGGSGTLAGDTDVAIASPSNGQVLTYNSSTGKWQNQVAPSAPVTSVAGKTGAVTLNESDIANLTTDLAAKAPLNSPTFTGTVTVPTPSNTTDATTKAYVDSVAGSSTLLASDNDVAISSPANGQVLTYNSTSSKWQNLAAPVTSVAGKTGAVTLAESDVANLTTDLAAKANTSTTITGTSSLTGGGDLSANRTLSLVNDSVNPGSQLYYGTDINGVKGFFAIANPTPLVVNTMPSFSYTGTIASYSGDFRWYNDTGRTLTISVVRASLGTAPAGSSAIFDVLKNGSTIFTTTANRPTIAAAANTAVSGTPDVTAVANGEYLTVNISQVGSTTPGADLTLTVVMS